MPDRARASALPEDHAYVDSGCHLHPSCLACPREVCYFDAPPRADQKASRRARIEEAANLHRAGRTAFEIATIMSIQKRTAFRYLEEARDAGLMCSICKVGESK